MDNLTHTLVGAALGQAFFRSRLKERAVPVLALASNLPDIDAVVMLSGDPAAILLRRTFGHSLLLLPLWSAGLAWALSRWKYKDLSVRTLYLPILIGALTHLLFDLINSFGVVLLWPLSGWRPEFSITLIIDLALTGLLAAPALLWFLKPLRPHLEGLSRAALAAAGAYLLLCASCRSAALVALSGEAGRLGVRPGFVYAFPEPFGPLHWRGVLKVGGIYRLYLIDVLSNQVEPRGEVETFTGGQAVRQARETPLAKRLESFFKAPVWTLRTGVFGRSGEDPVEVTVRDLRFLLLLLPRRTPFQFSFLVYPGGRVEML